MSKLRLLGTVFVLAVAGLAIWAAGSGMKTGRTDSAKNDTPDAAYDYQAKDVVVTQLGPDGSLQYELSAKQITQQPKNGQLTAEDLVMHRDPPGSPPDGPNRLTLRANRADLPESGSNLILQGDVRAEGRPQNSRVSIAVAAQELTFNMQTQEVKSDKPVKVTWGNSTMDAESVQMNIRTGDIITGVMKVNSGNGTRAPK